MPHPARYRRTGALAGDASRGVRMVDRGVAVRANQAADVTHAGDGGPCIGIRDGAAGAQSDQATHVHGAGCGAARVRMGDASVAVYAYKATHIVTTKDIHLRGVDVVDRALVGACEPPHHVVSLVASVQPEIANDAAAAYGRKKSHVVGRGQIDVQG